MASQLEADLNYSGHFGRRFPNDVHPYHNPVDLKTECAK